MSLRVELDKLASSEMPDLTNGVPGLQLFDRDKPAAAVALGERARQVAELEKQKDSWGFYVGLVVAIAVVLRVMVVLTGPLGDERRAYASDTPVQIELADNLADHLTYGLAEQPAESLQQHLDKLREERGSLPLADANGLRPEAFQAPGYPVVLAAFRLTGLPLTGLLLVQCALGGAGVALTYAIAKALLRRKGAAIAAAALVALHPSLVLAAAVLDGNTVTVTLVLLGLFAVVDLHRRTLRRAVGGGAALGLAALFSPLLVGLTPVAAAWVLLSERRLRGVALAGVLLVGAAVPVGGWVYRNTAAGLDARLAAQPAVDRLFGTVAHLHGPMEPSTAAATENALLAAVRTESRLPAYTDRTLFDAVDHLAFARLGAEKAAAWRLLQDRATLLALDHGAERLHGLFGLRYTPAGGAERFLGRDTPQQAEADPATAPLIAVWVGLNAVLVVMACVGGALLVWRCRFGAVALVIAVGGVVMWMALTGPGDAARGVMLPLVALLVGGLFLPDRAYVPREKRARIREPQRVRAGLSPLASERPAVRDLPHPALALGGAAERGERVIAGGRPI